MNFIEESKYRGIKRAVRGTLEIPEASPSSELSTPAHLELKGNNNMDESSISHFT
jgi:hypothetical protein